MSLKKVQVNRKKSQNKKPQKIHTEPVIRLLKSKYPDAHCALNFKNPFELLVATVLSAQCTDERVNIVTEKLFQIYPDPFKMAQADISDLEKLVYSAGFYKNKAKNLKAAAQALVEIHGGEIPRKLEELTVLPGVGRKTANVVLGNAFGIPSGVVVDTHVGRLVRRFGWVNSENPVIVEQELMKLIPVEDWIFISHYLIFHGRKICKARKPACQDCFLFDLCLKKGVN